MTIKEFIESPEKRFVRKWRNYRAWKKYFLEEDYDQNTKFYLRTVFVCMPDKFNQESKKDRLEAFLTFDKGVNKAHNSYANRLYSRKKIEYQEHRITKKRITEAIKQLGERK